MTDPFLFICGRGRSGTTLVRAMIDSHPEIAIADESHFVVTLGLARARYERLDGFDAARFLRDVSHEVGFQRWKLDPDGLAAAVSGARDYPDAVRRLYAFYAAGFAKQRYGDKTPIYVLHIPLLAEMFPEARFLHVIRDGRNASLSYMHLDFGPRTLGEAAIYWRRFVGAGRAAGRALGPDRYAEVRYEDVLADPEEEMRRLAPFAGVAFDASMLRYFERAPAIVGAKDHYRNVYLPPTTGLRDWRTEMSPAEVATFEALAGDLLADLGYERAVPRPPASARVAARREWLRLQTRRAARRAAKATGLRKWRAEL